MSESDVDAAASSVQIETVNLETASNEVLPAGHTKPFTNKIHCFFTYNKLSNKSLCQICNKSIAGKYSTNLEYHIRSKHPDKFNEFSAKKATQKQPKKKQKLKVDDSGTSTAIQDCFKKLQQRKDGSKKGTVGYNKTVRKLAIAFVANSLSYCLIDDKYFRDAFSDVIAEFPNRHEISDLICGISDELKISIKSSIAEAKFCTLMIDLWSRPGYSASFIGITCHYFNRELGKLKRALLACRAICQPHTGENIFEAFNSIIAEWDIPDSKIFRIVTDNGANVVKAFRECLLQLAMHAPEIVVPFVSGVDIVDNNLEDSFVEEDRVSECAEYDLLESDLDSYFTRQKRISCFAHNLMLATKNGLEKSDGLKSAKDKALSLIGTFGKRPKAIEMLKEKTGGLGIVKPITTRWIYWYYVFDRLIKIKRSICDVCDELNIIHELGPADWKLLDSVRSLLAPFAQAVTRLEGEKYAAISEVYPYLFSLKEKINRVEETACSSITQIVRQLRVEVSNRFGSVFSASDFSFDPTYVVATLLDPCYPLLIEGDLLISAKQELESYICTYPVDVVESEPDRMESSPASDDLLHAVREKIAERRSSSVPAPISNEFELELQQYFCKAKSAEADSDPFEFWNQNKDCLPKLFNVAVDILSIPATSAPVERVFSRASIVLAKNRHNLSNEKMEKEVFFKFNAEFLKP